MQETTGAAHFTVHTDPSFGWCKWECFLHWRSPRAVGAGMRVVPQGRGMRDCRGGGMRTTPLQLVIRRVAPNCSISMEKAQEWVWHLVLSLSYPHQTLSDI